MPRANSAQFDGRQRCDCRLQAFRLHAAALVLGDTHQVIVIETSQRGLIRPAAPDGTENGVVVVGTGDALKKFGPIVAMPKLPDVYATHFYAVLRELDGMGLREIFIEVPPARPEWEAVRDRIVRATRALG